MSSKASIEVFIPAYGPSPYLSECIESVLANGSFISKCTVIDDCSPTSEILETIEKYSDRVFYVRNQVNLGLAATFQRSFELSESMFTVVMGSDDRMLPEYGHVMRQVIEKFPESCLIHPGVMVINEFGIESTSSVDHIKRVIAPNVSVTSQMESKKIFSSLLIGDWMYFPSISWNTKVMKSFPLDSRLRTAVDLDLLVRLCRNDELFVVLPNVIFQYRRHSESVSSQLLLDGSRIAEELEIHLRTSSDLRGQNQYKLSFLAFLAPTVRLHAIKVSIFHSKGIKSRLTALAFAFRIK